jgi:hypothetical protein
VGIKKVGNSTGERLRRIIWRCNNKYATKGEKGCENKHADDRVLYQAFINTFNVILENKAYFTQRWQEKKNSEDFLQRYKAQQFMKIIQGVNPITEFDMDLYLKMVEKMTVFEGDKIIVSLLDETEIECEIEWIINMLVGVDFTLTVFFVLRIQQLELRQEPPMQID